MLRCSGKVEMLPRRTASSYWQDSSRVNWLFGATSAIPLCFFGLVTGATTFFGLFFSLALPLATSARGLQETFCFQREFAQSQGIGSSGDDIHHQGQVRDLVHGTNASPSLSGLQLEQNLVCGRSGNSSAAGVKIVSALILRAGMYLADNVPEYWPTKMLA